MRPRRRSKRHGFLVIMSLMFCIVLLLLGMGFMESQASRYKSVVYATQAAQARGMAMAGLEDARLKVQNDICFPPIFNSASSISGYTFATADQHVFSYMETYALDNNSAGNGSYSVVVNTTYGIDPYLVYEVDSLGILGDPRAPTAVYHLQAEIDMNTTRNFCRYTHIQDDSAP